MSEVNSDQTGTCDIIFVQTMIQSAKVQNPRAHVAKPLPYVDGFPPRTTIEQACMMFVVFYA